MRGDIVVRESKAGSAKRRKAVWIAGISFGLILVICCLSIGFFYTSHIKTPNSTMRFPSDLINHTFYLFHKKIYTPVPIPWKGQIVTEEIPDYIGKPSSDIAKITLDTPLRIFDRKGALLGEAEGDFLYDTEEQMNQIHIYEILDQDRNVIPGIIWAEAENGTGSVAVEIAEPYSGKMCHLNKWEEYALDILLMTEAKNGGWNCQYKLYFGESKYFKNIKEDLSYKFRRNWAFFYHDVFE